jgi:MSHA biogenesis protein MshK
MLIPLSAVAFSQGMADPTRPPSAAADISTASGTPLLQSIKSSPSGSTAMVNGRLLRVGDKLDGAKVVRITETGLVLSKNGALNTLSIFPDIHTWPAATDAPRANPTSR